MRLFIWLSESTEFYPTFKSLSTTVDIVRCYHICTYITVWKAGLSSLLSKVKFIVSSGESLMREIKARSASLIV